MSFGLCAALMGCAESGEGNMQGAGNGVAGSGAAGTMDAAGMDAAGMGASGTGAGGEPVKGPIMCGTQDNCAIAPTMPHIGATGWGENGMMAEIVSGDEPALMGAVWEVKVFLPSGAQSLFGTVAVSTWSPDCDHAGPLDPIDVKAKPDGLYRVSSFHSHGGPWETVLDVTDMDGETEVTDQVRIAICIPGDPVLKE
jgi:hypothetical protein